jgi:DnaK suppressor protein
MNEHEARQRVARERARVEETLATLDGEIRADGALGRQQAGEGWEAGSALAAEGVSIALAADFRDQLAAVGRAEDRLAQGTYGISVESGAAIPAARLEAEPLAERTVVEQRLADRHPPR